jgi:thiosulfate reductase cytochrome b subunit
MSTLPADPRARFQRRHSLVVRITHWVNVLAVLVLLMSGLQILNAHPALYWGDSSYTGAPPLLAFDRIPGWLTIPSTQWLAMGRRWHFFFAWIFVVNGLVYLVYSLASRHVARDLVPSRPELGSIGRSIAEHLRMHRPQGAAAERYNVLQKLAYLAIVFGVLPFMLLMGLGLSPRLDAAFPAVVQFFGGRQAVRTLHFAAGMLIVAFVAIHLFQVLVTGAWNNLRGMITGRYRIGRGEGDEGRR